MEIFRFKRFEVRNERSAMKVNTDGVLLGAAMTLAPTNENMLDIGTGTGTIALMVAQRMTDFGSNEFHITGIDIDEDSSVEAAGNFKNSPWSEQLTSRHISLQELNAETNKFDVIFTNPPYFESSLRAPDERRRTARHTETLSFRDVISFAQCHLTKTGRLSIIIPYDIEMEVVRYAASFGLSLLRRVRVRTTPQRQFSRTILEFTGDVASGAGREETVGEELTIQNKGGYSDEYRSLVKDFLLISSD